MLLFFRLIPKIQMKEWKELFFRCIPLYEPIKSSQSEDELYTLVDPAEPEKQKILTDLDYYEYTVSFTVI